MPLLAEQFLNEEDYWEIEKQSPIRHEYFNGSIYAMAGGTPEHALLIAAAARSLGNQLEGRPCRVVSSDLRVKVEVTGLNTYPDVIVFCPPFRFAAQPAGTLLNPRILIEVLSSSTESYDRGAKFDHYKHLASLTDYLLIAQDHVQVDHYRRQDSGHWLLQTARTMKESIALDSIGVTLPLAELYNNIEFSPDPLPLRPQIPDAELPEP